MAEVADLLFLALEEDNTETLTLDDEEDDDDDDDGEGFPFSPPPFDLRRRQIPASDSDSDSNYLDDQVTLALDLFDGRSPHPPLRHGVDGGVGDPQIDPFDFGGDEEISAPSSPCPWSGLRIVGFDSESDSDDEHFGSMNPVPIVEEEPDQIGDDLGLPLCWDCFRIEEDRRDVSEEFEWEEVDGRVEENVVEDRSIVREEAHLVFGEVEEDGLDRDVEEDDRRMFQMIREFGEHVEDEDEEDERVIREIDWEVLLSVNNLDRTVPVEHDDDSYLGDDHEDYVYTSEYEILFGQFADHDSFINGRPPAAKSVVASLPSVVLTEEDVANSDTLCAVCKDEISLKESAKQLPCGHHYHGECILPWLGIRNTCPVCRYELPTDDPDYEGWRARRAGTGGAAQV